MSLASIRLPHPWFGAMMAPLLLLIIPAPIRALEPCQYFPHFSDSESKAEHPYRINTTSLQALPLDLTESTTAIIMGAEAWNRQSNGGYFRTLGTTTRTSLPNDINDPICSVLDASVVWYDAITISGYAAEAIPRCCTSVAPKTGCTRFEIRIYKWKENLFIPPFTPFEQALSVGDTPPEGATDIAALLTHEFGHTLGIYHPTQPAPPALPVYATMKSGVFDGTTSRDLFEYDIRCAQEAVAGYSTRRLLQSFYRVHSAGILSTETPLLGGWCTARAAAGATLKNGVWQWSSAFPRTNQSPYCSLWMPGTQYSNARCLPTQADDAPIGPRATVWREDPSNDRVLFSSRTEYPSLHGRYSNHRVEYVRSTDGFNTPFSSPLRFCSSAPSPFMTPCGSSDQSYLYSANPVSTTWHSGLARSINAWTRHDRSSEGQPANLNREVLVSVGFHSNNLLPEPDSAGVRSSVAPAVTCGGPGSAGAYDCIVAYVDVTDARNNVRFRRFSVSTGASRFVATFQTGYGQVMTNVTTASDLAAWYHAGAYWISIRPARFVYGQETELYFSFDSITWTYFGRLGHSAVGPSAVSYYSPDNLVILSR